MNWSYSKLGCFAKCPAKFKYKYIEKLPEEKNAYATRGLDKHGLLEHYLLGNLTELPPELGYYQRFLDDLKLQGALPEEMFCFDRNWNRVDKDHDDIWVKAVADAVVPKLEEVYVYDWKTGKIYDTHTDQRELYALCAFKAYPEVKEVVGIHTYIDLFENRLTRYHRDMVPEIQQKWENKARSMLEATEYPPVSGWHCKWCSFSRYKGGPCRN